MKGARTKERLIVLATLACFVGGFAIGVAGFAWLAAGLLGLAAVAAFVLQRRTARRYSLAPQPDTL